MEWDDFIGQRRATRQLRILAETGWSGNLLLRGNYGHGKTTLAILYMESIGNYAYYSTPSKLEEINDLAVAGFNLIVDEIHLLRKQEYLYEAMGGNGNMVFCTTDAGELSPAFKSRCTELRLVPYTDQEIAAIIYTTLARDHILIQISQAEFLASRSHGNPRVAINLASMVYRMIVYDGMLFDLEGIENQLEQMGIDSWGYDDRHRSYISYLMSVNQPVGLKTLSAVLDIPQADIKNEIEPALLRNKHIEYTNRGRRLTDGNLYNK